VTMTTAEGIWYVILCICFGGGYLHKVIIKKGFSEVGPTQRTSAENFWYALQCLCFGAGYFAKMPVKRALADI